MRAATSTARLEVRISSDLHAMLKRAAEIQGHTMTDFVVSAARDAAQQAIELLPSHWSLTPRTTPQPRSTDTTASSLCQIRH